MYLLTCPIVSKKNSRLQLVTVGENTYSMFCDTVNFLLRCASGRDISNLQFYTSNDPSVVMLRGQT